jgi:hypothetical protein
MMRLHGRSASPSFRLRLRALAILSFFVCTLLSGYFSCAQSNAITLPRNLEELVVESQTVVQGWVTSVTVEPHPQLKNLMTVVVTIRVEDTLKGNSANSYTFRQAVIDRRDLQKKLGYRTGQNVLMILYKTSQFGLTSPAGMEQGRFRIEPGSTGILAATNGFGNAGLFRGLDSQLRSKGLLLSPEVQTLLARVGAGPIGLEQLKILIRGIVGANSTK